MEDITTKAYSLIFLPSISSHVLKWMPLSEPCFLSKPDEPSWKKSSCCQWPGNPGSLSFPQASFHLMPQMQRIFFYPIVLMSQFFFPIAWKIFDIYFILCGHKGWVGELPYMFVCQKTTSESRFFFLLPRESRDWTQVVILGSRHLYCCTILPACPDNSFFPKFVSSGFYFLFFTVAALLRRKESQTHLFLKQGQQFGRRGKRGGGDFLVCLL